MVTQKTVLLIDGDQALFSALQQCQELLNGVEFQYSNHVSGPNPGADALIYALETLPESPLAENGYKICITSKVSAEAESGLFDACVTRPFRLGGLLALINSIFQEDFPLGPLPAGPCQFFPREKNLTYEKTGQSVILTEKETRLLLALCENAPRPVGRDALLEKVWRYNSGLSTHTLETHVYRLRQKIEHGLGIADFIATNPGGYSLTGN